MEKNEYILLLKRFLKGDTNSGENKKLSDWFGSDLSRPELENYVRSVWKETADASIQEDQKMRMFQHVQRRIIPEITDKRKVRPFSFIKSVMRYAAIILMIVGTALGSHLYTRHTLSTVPLKEYLVRSEKAQKASMVLPDGTKVWLNSDSKLRYTNQYGENSRTISLDGEAYFEVAKDSLSRFVVQAGDLAVEALGTSFNVKAYSADNQAVVTLFEGKVKASAGGADAFLSPDQAITYFKDRKLFNQETLHDASRACLWRNNELAFRGETLSEIAILLNRMYNVQVQFKTESVKKLRFTGVITNNSLDNIIELISLTSPIIYTSKGDTIIIDEKK